MKLLFSLLGAVALCAVLAGSAQAATANVKIANQAAPGRLMTPTASGAVRGRRARKRSLDSVAADVATIASMEVVHGVAVDGTGNGLAVWDADLGDRTAIRTRRYGAAGVWESPARSSRSPGATTARHGWRSTPRATRSRSGSARRATAGRSRRAVSMPPRARGSRPRRRSPSPASGRPVRRLPKRSAHVAAHVSECLNCRLLLR